VQRYLTRISGPLLDRIDIHVDVPEVKYRDLAQEDSAEDSACIRARVLKAREIQLERFRGKSIFCNAQMQPRWIRKYCRLQADAQKLLEQAITRLGLSARAYDRILKVSRTIADLDGSEQLERRYVAEAIQYRSLDRNLWS
jgi:magnesium chelatase family protein